MPVKNLPIWVIHGAIVDTLRGGNRLVLVAPTGSGKTTQVPQMLLDAGLAGEKKIVVLQPRRVAARTVAARVAWERNGKLGHEVGYQIRFEDYTSLGTRICFVTEGILLRWLQDDRDLADVSLVLFDEFHERNLLSDVSLALVKQLQETRRPDLKMIVMSATLDAAPVAASGAGAEARNRRHQCLGVGMARIGEQRLGRCLLDDPPLVHDGDVIAEMLDHRQVVADEEVCDAMAALKILHQVQDLGLDRDIEGGDRLVGNDQLRPRDQRAGDGDALALTAGEFMRVAAS